MKIIEIKCEREADCSAAVGMWNYWDHEHVSVMHEGMPDAKVLYEDKDTATLLLTLRAPIFSFIKVRSMIFMRRRSETSFTVFNTMLGMSVVSEIDIVEIELDKSKYNMRYRFILVGWREFFSPIIRLYLKLTVPWWNARQWREDLPIKLRRQKMVRAGFLNFNGLPKKIEDRFYNGPIKCDLPVPRLKNSKVSTEVLDTKTIG
ncbi:MAG: hypothetical protein VX923_06920 [Pseudomonadota bacterium]|nr:hypothetical protein [Pseudomonadota bacterium]